MPKEIKISTNVSFMPSERNITGHFNILKEESVCERKFYGFCGFGSDRKSLFPQNIAILVNCESFFPAKTW